MISTKAFTWRRGLVPAAAIALLISFSSARAQFDNGGTATSSSGGQTTTGNSALYNYGQEGVLSININLWGFVGSPGKYVVPSSTTLIQLISMAGGPAERARLSDVRILHDMAVDSTLTEPVNVFNLEEYQRTGRTEFNPLLIENDTVVVPGDALNVFRDILAIFRDVALVIGTLLGLILALKGAK